MKACWFESSQVHEEGGPSKASEWQGWVAGGLACGPSCTPDDSGGHQSSEPPGRSRPRYSMQTSDRETPTTPENCSNRI